ncbi:MAG: hypothetical protein MJK10_14260, partial [Pseudomonadales bacterium]|nr:hypothetical protein [Pseudomonadales bacterium]NRA17316.1 hypothetical protein [Oceanospirillaceae bacterium]
QNHHQQNQDQQSQDQQSQDQQSQDQQSQDQQSPEQLQQLQQQRQQAETQALQQLDKNPRQQIEGETEVEVGLQLSEEQLKHQQLQNWLGQLPEDASRLVRNKFNYEYQKKRQAYLQGQWQPTQEQRW